MTNKVVKSNRQSNHLGFAKAIQGFLDATGFDWIHKLVVGIDAKIDPDDDPELNDLRVKKNELSETQLEGLLIEITKLHSEEEKRQDTLESKAASLVGSITLASGFVVGVSQLSINGAAYTPLLRLIVIVLNALIGTSLLISVTLALQATRVGKYKFIYPSLSTFWTYKENDRKESLISRAITSFYCQIYNREVINLKASYVIGAQQWFRNTIVLFFVLSVVLGVPPLLSSGKTEETPIQAIVLTPTQFPTSTPTPTITATLAPTLSPAITP